MNPEKLPIAANLTREAGKLSVLSCLLNLEAANYSVLIQEVKRNGSLGFANVQFSVIVPGEEMVDTPTSESCPPAPTVSATAGEGVVTLLPYTA